MCMFKILYKCVCDKEKECGAVEDEWGKCEKISWIFKFEKISGDNKFGNASEQTFS